MRKASKSKSIEVKLCHYVCLRFFSMCAFNVNALNFFFDSKKN